MTNPDYSVPILDGPGDTDYARYMKTDALLSLQRPPDVVVHRDELLFQVVHQSTELWLKLACSDVDEAQAQLRLNELAFATQLLTRASLAMQLITDQLEMLTFLAPWDFQTVRTILGHGSGFESPGWKEAQRASQELHDAFLELTRSRSIDLVDVYRGSQQDPLYQLCEALVGWDERIGMWRSRHYKVATRIIGHNVMGTKGTPVDVLAKLLSHKFFPELWAIRTELTEVGPMGHMSRG